MEEIEWTKGRRRAEKGSETKGDEIGGGKKKRGRGEKEGEKGGRRGFSSILLVPD